MKQEEKFELAKKRVDDLKGFYHHLLSFFMVNVILFVIDVATSPGEFWFYWVTLFWGIGILSHGVSVFGFNNILGKDWEERKIREYMEKMEQQEKKEK
ncbi:MAG TPA: 2TM domain-containing protein [Firmicutes bacterium]|nr:2TM domain-containing protein [Bacillota bacterium]